MINKLDIPKEGIWPYISEQYENKMVKNLNYYMSCFQNHASNVNAPYHNIRHTKHVLWCSNILFSFYTEEELSMLDRYIISTGVIFHDFDHAGNSIVPDSVNIGNAYKALKKFILAEDKSYKGKIMETITITEVPSKYNFQELPIQLQFLPEADRSQVLASDWMNQIVGGFSREWNKSPNEILGKQENFLKDPQGLLILTRGAKEIFPPLREKRIKETRALLGLNHVAIS